MAIRQTKIVNFYESTLAGLLASGSSNTTLTAAPTTDGSTAISASPGDSSTHYFLVIDPDNASNREVVLVDNSSGTTITNLERDREGRYSATSPPDHQIGTTVRMAVLAEHFVDANDTAANAKTVADAALPKAGGTMTGTVDFDGQEVTQPKLAGYEEKVSDLGALTSGTTDCDLEAHNVFEADIQGTVTLNLTNVDSALLESATFILKNTTGTAAVSWQINGGAKTPLTPGAAGYTQTASGTDIVGVLCYEGNLYLNSLVGFA
tara:strand:+ start:2015 stop:2806 length:792 start_codon:yes stop_codon:yes gene_type:complete